MNSIAMNRICWIAAASLMTVAAHAQTAPKLTARELFYTPVQTAQSESKTPPRTEPVPDTKAAATNKTKKTTTRVKDSGSSVVEPPYLDAKAKGKDLPPRVKTNGGGTVVPMINASNETALPLAIRYSVMKLNEDGGYDEVRPDSNFRSGDKLRIAVEANDAGYLYLIQRGSSKTWSVLFPNSEYEGGSNHITAARRQVIPGKARFTLDDTPGAEKLFLVFSRKPEPDLEKLIYTLSTGESNPAAKPANTPSDSEPKKTMLASAKFDDPFIDRMRSKLVSRDLVFETVDEKKADKKDTATYVATPDKSPNARVVADFTLLHK